MRKEKDDTPVEGTEISYREWVHRRLAEITPVLEKVSMGDFSQKIEVPRDEEDEFSELFVGLNLMVEDLRFMFEENRSKTEELERRLTELSVLNEIGRALGSTLKLDELMEVIYTQTSRVMDTESFYIALYNDLTGVIEFPIFIEGGRRIHLSAKKFSEGLTEHIIKTRDSLLIREDVSNAAEKLGIKSEQHGDPALCWLGVPMISQESVVGVISVQSTRKPGLYDEDHQRLLQAIANAAAGAVVNARTFEEVERRVGELAAFNEVGRALGTTLKLEERLKIIYEQARKVMPADHFYVALYHPAEEEAGAEVEFVYYVQDGKETPSHTRPFNNGLTEHIIKTTEPLLIQRNLRAKIAELNLDVQVLGTPAKSWLGVPLVARGEVIGVMAVQSVDREEAYDEGHKDLLISLASQASGAIDNARAYRELEINLTELSVLGEISRAIGSTLNIEELYTLMHEQINRLMDADNFYIALYDHQVNEVSFPFAMEQGKRIPTGSGEWATRRAGHGMTEYVINTGKPQVVQGDSEVELAKREINHIGRASHSWIGAPMVARNQVIGVVAVQAITSSVRYSRKHLRLLQQVANQAAPAVENARAYHELENNLAELKRTEAELEEREQLYRTLIQTAQEAITLADPEEKIKFANPACGELLGYEPEELLGRSILEFVPPEEVKRVTEQTSLRKKGETSRYELTFINKNGEFRNVLVTAAPIYDAEGNFSASMGVLTDITERKRAEEALREREELYRTLITTSQEAIVLVDAEDIILFANPAALQLFGYNDEEFINHSFYDFLPADQKELVRSQTVRRIQGETSRYELMVVSRDGSPHRILVNAAPIYDADGNFTAAMAILTDITEISAINDISRAISSILDINELYGVIHEQIKQVVNADNFYIALYDQELDEVSFPYAFQDGEIQSWKSRRGGGGMTEFVIRNRKPHLFVESSEAETTKLGVTHIGKPSQSWLGVPMISRNEVIGVMTVQSFDPDIQYSERHMKILQMIANQAAPAVENAQAYAVLEVRVKERTAELAKSNDALEDFVYTVSHDLKAPLRAILGFSQFLLEDYGTDLPDEGRMYVERMSASAKRMERLINDLLELSRVGRIKNPYENTDITELVNETVATLAPGDKVTVRIEGPMPNIVCDRVRIGQVFANLISNAVKYNDKEKTEITVGFEEGDADVEFFVADNGPGIEEKYHEKIFKIFQRLSADESGTGIGLALVKKIVEDHKGRIWVESEMGQGTTFKFVLPKEHKVSVEE